MRREIKTLDDETIDAEKDFHDAEKDFHDAEKDFHDLKSNRDCFFSPHLQLRKFIHGLLGHVTKEFRIRVADAVWDKCHFASLSVIKECKPNACLEIFAAFIQMDRVAMDDHLARLLVFRPTHRADQ